MFNLSDKCILGSLFQLEFVLQRKMYEDMSAGCWLIKGLADSMNIEYAE